MKNVTPPTARARRTCTPGVASVAGLLLAACATPGVGPLPQAGLPAAAWHAPLPHGGQPEALAAWWQTFHDPALLELQQAAQDTHPDLDRALAAIRRARADLVVGQAAGQVQLGLQSSLTRSGSVGDAAYTDTSTRHSLDASWEADLFGRNRRTVAALEAESAARTADWHAARVSIAAEVALDYVDFRTCRLRAGAYRDQAESYRKTLAVTRVNVAAGFTAPADAHLTAAGAAAAGASLTAEEARCTVQVKALVTLSGLPEAQVDAILADGPPAVPVPAQFRVDTIPADLLRQRPDLAAAEQRLVAAYQRIGAAQAARWPGVTLTGSLGLAHSALLAPNPWSMAGALTLPLYTAGADAARVDAARADCDAARADYTGLIRRAVQDVEVALVNLDSAALREHDLVASADDYRAYFRAAEIDWRAGRLPLLDLETARRNAVMAELLAIDVRGARVQQWVALYKALGGGWTPSSDTAVPSGSTP